MSQSQQVTISQTEPEGFKTHLYVAGAYIEVGGKLLLLQTAPPKEHAHLWGLPAGKLEAGELPEAALQRELFEETGIQLPDATPIATLSKFYVQKNTLHYVFHVFEVPFADYPKVILSKEHQAYSWVRYDEICQLPVIAAAHEILTACHHLKSLRPHSG